MSSKNLEQIFTIFKRLHTHDEYEGYGIGLEIAQKIVTSTRDRYGQNLN